MMDARSDEYRKAVTETKTFYDRFAQYYDEFVPPDKMRNVRIDSLIDYIREKILSSDSKLHFLELGCGTASYAIPLAKSGHHVIGVDISSEMQKLGIKKLREESPVDFEYLTSDWLTALEKWESAFDCVLCIGNSLIHNPPSMLPAFFTRSFSALKPGGILILNGRRIERELYMIEGSDASQDEVCRSGGPAHTPGTGLRIVLRFMFMTKVNRSQENKTVITFYTYDNYERDGRHFVCHRMLFNNSESIETTPVQYDTWATKTFFIFEDRLIKILEECGYSGVKEESPDEKHFKLEKNWYIVAQKPIS